MSDHYVTVTGTPDDPEIVFECRGDRDSECHSYPDCTCETWTRDDHPHEFVPHDECWMQPWFDNDCVSPSASDDPDVLEGLVGMSGPIRTQFEVDYIWWEFDE